MSREVDLVLWRIEDSSQVYAASPFRPLANTAADSTETNKTIYMKPSHITDTCIGNLHTNIHEDQTTTFLFVNDLADPYFFNVHMIMI